MASSRFGTGTMMQLGNFQFGISTAAYQEMERSAGYRWAAHDRLGALAGLQFTGPDEETISLPGVIYPEFRGGFGQVDGMRVMAGGGEPLALVDGTGKSLGRWVITSVNERGSVFDGEGKPRRIEFTLELRRFPDAKPETVAAGDAALLASDTAAIPASASGAAAQAKGLAASVSSAAGRVSSNLQRTREQIEAAISPTVGAARQALGGVTRALDAVGELQSMANGILSIAGIETLDIAALNRAQNMAVRASALTAPLSSASAMVRISASTLEETGGTASALTAIRAAQVAVDSAGRLAQQTASEAAKITG